MKSRIPLGLALMLVALVLSFVPAASMGTQSASALSACDWAQFVADVTVPDGTVFAANAAFTKTWRLKNIGSCTWTTSYALVFDSGNPMGGPTSVNLPNSVSPGQTVDVSVGLTAPGSAGHYIGYWKFMNASASRFGIGSNMNTPWWVDIRVGSGSSGVAYDFASNYCAADWFSSAGNLPCPGTDGDPRGFVLKVNNPQLENGTTDSGSGLITNPRNIFNGDIHGRFPAFHVQHGDRFQSIINCAYGATGCYVSFRLDYQIDGGPVYTFWAFREKYEGLYYRADVDLNSLAGKDVKFILTVLADGPAGGDRALWSNPAIVRLGPPGPPPPPASALKFDFGDGAHVAAGYTSVTATTAYTAALGYGWTDITSLQQVDRGAPLDDLNRDFVFNDTSAARTFQVALPPGNYSVTVTMGDQGYLHDNMVVTTNGGAGLTDVDSPASDFTPHTFSVTVPPSGLLQLGFDDNGGSDGSWVVNAVTISSPSAPPPPPSYGCDRAQFVADVTVPDDTVFAPGATFLKIWRLKNVGTCTWNTSYKMIFDTGDQMGGPSSVNMPMIVPPGHTVDVGVNLTAPSTGGLYRGYWKFQNASSVPFGIGAGANKSWWVEIVVSGPPGPPPPPPPPSASGAKFDFGTSTSPVASGYTKVTEATAYSAGNYGWTDTSLIQTRDRGTPASDLNRDLALNDSGGAGTFKVDVPNGSYSVTVIMGDKDYAHDDMVVKANTVIVLPDVDTAVNTFVANSFNVVVTTGSLELEFSDAGGLDTSWVINAVSIGNQFDFGTSGSPVATGYTMVDETTAFTTALGYGWTDTSTLESRDRGLPDALKEDFVMSSSAARIFKVALLNGSYSVTVTMGDNDNAHDNMVVKANGSTVVGDVDSAAGAFTVNTFPVTVSGGALQLEFSDGGGSDATWVLNAVTISP